MAFNGTLANSNITAGYMDLATAWKMEGEFMYSATPMSRQYNNPEGVTYFKRAVVRSTWFTQIPVALRTSNGVPAFGQEFSVTIARLGDYVTSAWLRVVFPAVTLLAGNQFGADGRLRWCRKIMHNLLDDCNITFNEQQVARLDNYILDMLSQFMTPAGKQDGYDAMIGDVVSMTGSHGATTPLGATIASRVCNLPLPFFFSRDSGIALPTSSLLFNDVKLNFKFRDWSQLLILDNSGAAGAGTVARAVPVVGTDITSAPVLQGVNVWSNVVLVSNYERSRMATGYRDIIIDQVQSSHKMVFAPISAPNPVYEPKFIFAVKALFFAVQNTTFANEWSNYATNSPYNSGNTVDFTPQSTAAPVDNITLNYESTTRLSEMGWDYFSYINPYNCAKVIPREIGYGLYSYALDLGRIDPNGSTNFSKIQGIAVQPKPSTQAIAAAGGAGAAGTGYDFQQTYQWINLAWNYTVIRIGDGQLTFPFV